MPRSLVLLALSLTLGACSASTPTAPTTSPSGGQPGGSLSTRVCLSDVVAAGPVAGISVSVDSRAMGASDASGSAVLYADSAGQHDVTFSGPGVITRTTSIRIPAIEAQISLIPASFDAVAFNEMFRPSARLQRWTAAPPLVILTRAVQYEGNYADNPVVVDEQVSAVEQQQMATDLTEGFAMLTDRQLGAFTSVTFESPAPGTRVNVMRNGSVLVARSRGLTAGTPEHYWGYGRWAATTGGVVVGGNVMIDADFDGPSSGWPQYRRSVRIHELGHALGYNHVTARPSVMNSAARMEPNAWDLQAVHIAFLRPPGNTSPDNDPSSFSVNARTGGVRWSPPLF